MGRLLWWDDLPMEHDDDPEKRIAELERSQGRASAGRPVEQPPAYPPAPQPGWQQAPGWQQQPQPWQPPVSQSGHGSPPAYSASLPATSQPLQSKRSRAKKGISAGILLAGIMMLVLVGDGGYALYAFSVGTPTTATVDQCTSGSGKSSRICWGTWTNDGAWQHGKVKHALGSLHEGSVVDVRVHNGTAYTLRSVAMYLFLFAAVAVVMPLVLFWQIRKRRRLK